MKHLNKSIIATTLLTSLFLAQPVLAGEQAAYDDNTDHQAPSMVYKVKHEHVMQVEDDDNTDHQTPSMVYKGKHKHEEVISEAMFSSGE